MLPALQPLAVPDPDALEPLYTGKLSVESSHIDNIALVRWIDAWMESGLPPLDEVALRRAHFRLVQAEEFERFLGKRFPGKKRFGLEGAESAAVLLDRLLVRAADQGIDEVLIGGMHRGRLNLMANVLGKPLEALFAEFKGAYPFAGLPADSADVPYHLGLRTVLRIGGRELRITLLPNPSHLEAVDPVVLGGVRAAQDARPDADRRRVLGVILHTDAAVAGQGVVAETLQLSGIEAYTTGGTIHVVINNQIGFTTQPEEGRASQYCTGPWKAIDSLILHVNGDSPEAVIRAADMAMSCRIQHGCDAVIDLLAYRRNGHNEMDEPRFTQPLLYRQIDDKPAVRELFENHLMELGVMSAEDCGQVAAAYRQELAGGYAGAGAHVPAASTEPGEGGCEAASRAMRDAAQCDPGTGLDREEVLHLLESISTVPPWMQLGDKLRRLVEERALPEKGVAWATAEALALGSLLMKGIPVRFSGQDSLRGAFSQRHFCLVDTRTGARHVTLDNLGAPARFVAVNSPLSEYAALGFEYGYSLMQPSTLVVWEAQFGDFANGAQVMIDQFISSGKAKWRQASKLVMLLPHGLEGQGPEHSSARIERYLQLAAGDNLMIANPTTPANYFHLLRRHVLSGSACPLVVMAPKTLLRLPAAVSALEDFGTGTAFKPVIVTTPGPAPSRILFCSGKIAYELERERERRQAWDVSIVRIESLYPVPTEALADIVRYRLDAELVWVQEEPENMGAWAWYDRKLEDIARSVGHRSPRFVYRGRAPSASPAASFHGNHDTDQAAIVASAYSRC
ncbi:2-oxoglutarate dehydrogenase E1 component [Candidimonas nitroreducens]|nr:2-oxoglutarate dehydrogenase E1 component [Candidimonas nitroreducens]